MLLPKLTVAEILSDMTEDDIISAICEKNEQLNQLVVSSKMLEVVKCCDIKNNTVDIQHKQVAIKCSAENRSYIMNTIGGYIFVGLCRCKI